jgi:subtilase family serine protease
MSAKILCAAILAVFLAAGPIYAAEAKPDLIIESVYWEYAGGHGDFKGKVQPGDTIHVTVEVRNIGQAAAGPFRVQLEIRWVDGQKIKYERYLRDVKLLPPQERKIVIFKKKRVVDGEYMFTARADYKNKVDEFIETNNEKIGPNMPVRPILRDADLVVTLTSPDASRRIGRKVLLRGTVKNVGEKRTNPCKLTLKCDGKKTKTANVPTLSARDTYKFEFKHRWSTRGKRKCEVWVDSNGKVKELSEKNNRAQLWIRIK